MEGWRSGGQGMKEPNSEMPQRLSLDDRGWKAAPVHMQGKQDELALEKMSMFTG